MKNANNKAKKNISKSARISIRTTPENKAEFVKRAKAQGCTQNSLFESMLWDKQQRWKKFPPTLFIPIDDAINSIGSSSCDYDINDIRHNLQILRNAITKLKTDYGYGGKK